MAVALHDPRISSSWYLILQTYHLDLMPPLITIVDHVEASLTKLQRQATYSRTTTVPKAGVGILVGKIVVASDEDIPVYFYGFVEAAMSVWSWA